MPTGDASSDETTQTTEPRNAGSGRARPKARPIWRHWLVIGGVAAILAATWLFFSARSERELRYLSEEPLRATIQRAVSHTGPGGFCDVEIWRLSEESAARLAVEGADALTSPHQFQIGWSETVWRPVSGPSMAAAPWNATACRDDIRALLQRLAAQSGGFSAVIEHASAPERAVFVLAPESRLFVRAVFAAAPDERLGAAAPAAER